MPDLEELLRRSAPPAPELRHPEPLAEIQARLGRRRRRRRAAMRTGLAGLLVAGLAVAVLPRSRPSGIAAGPTPVPDGPAVPANPRTPPTGPSLLDGLPVEGVAVAVPDGSVVLVGLDGREHGRLPETTVEALSPGPGPVPLGGWRGARLLDGRAGAVTTQAPTGTGSLRDFEVVAQPLAYGGLLVAAIHTDPPRWQVFQQGQLMADSGPRPDSTAGTGGGGLPRVSADLDIITVGAQALDLRASRWRDLPAGCWVADRHGSRWYVVCPAVPEVGQPTSVKLLGPDGRSANLEVGGATDGVRANVVWDRLLLSPDGTRVLLGASGLACSEVFLADIRAEMLAVTNGFAGEVGAEAVGWTSAGEAVLLLQTGCGAPQPTDDGLYLRASDGNLRLLFPINEPQGPDRRPVVAALWAPTLQ